jgi:RimJ/RimL family protein N-acetyltransferase
VVTVREARPEDAGELVAHYRGLMEEPDIPLPGAPDERPASLTLEEERAILADFAASDSALFLVAEAEGRVIGVLDVRGGARKATRHAALLGMSVAKEWRNRGVGTTLLARAIEWARTSGIITRIELIVYADNARAIHLYEKLGFRIEGRRRRAVFQRGRYLDDLVMGLLL